VPLTIIALQFLRVEGILQNQDVRDFH